MNYVYRSVPSNSARDLAAALEGRRLRDTNRLRNGDIVVCWGSRIANLPAGVRALNNVAVGNKLDDVERLRQAGVPTIEVSRTRPAVQRQEAVAAQAARPAVDPAATDLNDLRAFLDANGWLRGRPTPAIVTGLQTRVNNLARTITLPVTPAVAAVAARPAAEWLPRIINHVGGLDLLTPPARPEFWVKKENIVREFRIHSFLGKSIRSAIKVERDDPEWRGQRSAWVRSWDGGWRMAYRKDAVRQAHRDIAHNAVRALGLDFGAVDVGERADGSLLVLEVNRAPGLSEGSAQVYADAIREWSRGERAAQ